MPQARNPLEGLDRWAFIHLGKASAFSDTGPEVPSHQAHHKLPCTQESWHGYSVLKDILSIFSLKPHLLIVQTWSQSKDHDLLHATFP